MSDKVAVADGVCLFLFLFLWDLLIVEPYCLVSGRSQWPNKGIDFGG